jgi:colanic acid/amylovoran biosynthesis glycosyltransferase
MKIFVCTGFFPKLSETFVLNEVLILKRKGLLGKVFSLQSGTEEISHEKAENFKKKEMVQNIFDNSRIEKILSLVYFFIKNIFFHPVIAFTSLKTDTLRSCLLVNKIGPSLQSTKRDDVLYCHFGTVGLEFMALKKFDIFKGRFAIVFHGLDISKTIKSNKNVYKELFYYADFILPISNFWKNKLIELNCPKEKIQVHHMGIIPEDFLKNSLNNNNDDFKTTNILSIGRFVEKKGFEYSIKACSLLVKENINFQYHIIGSGSLEENLKKLVAKLKLESYITFMGSLTQSQVINQLEKTDIFLVPSITAQDGDMEGIPVVLMEAATIGIPIIATKHSGIPELIKHNVTGVLVEEKDIKGISESIQKYINMKKEGTIKSIIKNASLEVMDNFSTEKNIDKLEQLFSRK